MAFSNELRVDHSITCPIITLRPQADLPIVPVYTTIFAPPLPRPDLVERYRADPIGLVSWWEAEVAGRILNCPEPERSTWLELTGAERRALREHDYVALLELGAHNFLVLTLFIALFERDYAEPLAFQREFGARLSHWTLPYPEIAT